MDIGTWLIEFMTEHQITYTQLESVTGKHRGTISHWVSGSRMPKIANMRILAQGLEELTGISSKDILAQMIASIV